MFKRVRKVENICLQTFFHFIKVMTWKRHRPIRNSGRLLEEMDSLSSKYSLRQMSVRESLARALKVKGDLKEGE